VSWYKRRSWKKKLARDALEPARSGLLGSTSLSTNSSDDAGSDDSNDARRTNSKAYSSTAGNSGKGNVPVWILPVLARPEPNREVHLRIGTRG
jgi:hypothetical protein